jgi:hypothetical protein
MIAEETISDARGKSILHVANLCGAKLRKAGSEWNGPCPACGGNDRFWLNEAENVFLCRMSGAAGDAIALIRHKHQCGFSEAVAMLTGEKAMPVSERQAAPSTADQNEFREKARKRAWRVWESGYSIDPAKRGRLVRDYFELRGIPFPDWRVKVLREVDRLAYWNWSKERKEFVIVHSGPAMLAAITGPDGRFMGVHRTWLDLSHPSGKATIADPDTGEILPAKKVEGSQRGGKIVLRDGFTVRRMTLGEGIETVASWDVIHRSGYDLPALWVGINLDNIAGKAVETIPHPSLTAKDSIGRERRIKVQGPEPKPDDRECLQIPRGAFDEITLLGDSDSDRFTTQAAMIRAQRRLAIDDHKASIDWAPSGQDWNDALRARPAERKRAVA